MAKQRILIVGFGFMGQTHAGNILKNEGAELAGIVDSFDPSERLRNIRGNRNVVTISPEQVTGIPWYQTLDEALAKCSPDAAVVALPTKLHCPAVLKCLEHGCHVMVEKPFSLDMAECEAMVSAAEKAGRLLAVGYVVRFRRESRLIKETILSGRLGRLNYMALSRYTGIPDWGDWKKPGFLQAAGGALFDLVSHDIDFAHFCLGKQEAIEAFHPFCAVPDQNQAAMMLQYPGCRVFVEGGFMTPSTMPFRCRCEAFFEKGTLACDENGNYWEMLPEGVKCENYADVDPYKEELDCFVRAVADGDESGICPGWEAADTMRCCHVIQKQMGLE